MRWGDKPLDWKGFIGLMAPVALVLVTSLACAAPVGVKRVDARQVQRELNANVLSTGEPSAPTLQMLQIFGLTQLYADDPEAAIVSLASRIGTDFENAVLLPLAELCFAHAERADSSDYFIMAAVYAYAFLFPEVEAPEIDRLDPSLRLAADLYNRGLTRVLREGDPRRESREAVQLDLPLGTLEIEMHDTRLEWGDYRITDLQPAAEYAVRGLRNRFRRRGIGAPLIAHLEPVGPDAHPVDLMPGSRVPATALLRIAAPRQGLRDRQLRAELAIYVLEDDESVIIDGREVPLESEITSSLAYALAEASPWDFEKRRFFATDQDLVDKGLVMLTPFRPGRIPVVFVHGTASSAARWAEMTNDLLADPSVRARYQFWFFSYNTGNPIAYSSGLLRQALSEAVAKLDPGAEHGALRRMIVIGHSQGGLLAKMTSIDAGNRFWELVSDAPFEDFELPEGSRAVLERSLFPTPLPFVDRLIFIATPHRGSFVAGYRIAHWTAGLIKMPGDLLEAAGDLVLGPDGDHDAVEDLGRRVSTSVDNMTPSSPFIRVLSGIPVDPRVEVHSIIAVRGDGDPTKGNDGVVAYESAHVEEAMSEKVVRSGHSTQGQPATILEVHRILMLELAQSEPAEARAP